MSYLHGAYHLPVTDKKREALPTLPPETQTCTETGARGFVESLAGKKGKGKKRRGRVWSRNMAVAENPQGCLIYTMPCRVKREHEDEETERPVDGTRQIFLKDIAEEM